ncbi:hypothetical protein J5N97_015593 [Dioscorea zingiberensis]|uniref:Acidic protein n=1 Tax=Dioscorea zingiberensis TaxID=325984 RepID=A0A9D5CJF7_9LILI|nr:hypothetical protein J5N97_015593 [Dioscorea zingiberensis]
MNTTARNCYNLCRLPGTARDTCAKLCGCLIISGTKCPPNYPKHFCKLGCASSTCNAITSTLQDSDDVEGALAGCNNICSELCNDEGSNEDFTA